MGWRDNHVFFRDFAYSPRRLRMAHGDIGLVPATTYAELLSGSMIDIYVGESRRHWALHRNLLCHHSELLENELQGEDGKQQKEKLELPDHDPDGFELLVKWLYQGKLDDVSDLIDANQKYDYAVSCYKLYLLCERFDMHQLKNVAMDQYRKGLNEAELVPDAEEIDEIYRKSPLGSPFRTLMTRVAARQIMDPDSHRDVETYRQCFENNPDFAVDLVNAIKNGTGGMLFDDPTDPGNECEYHDHENGSSCHVKGKGKAKQVLKASAHRPYPKYSKSESSGTPDQHLLPHHPPRLIPHPQPPPRQARRQDGMGSGPLRRRLTSPASSTVETSTENATASPPSPKEPRNKFRQVPHPGDNQENPISTELPTAQDGLHQSSESEPLPPQNSFTSDDGNKSDASKKSVDEVSPPRRGIWEWAVGGTGRLGMLGKLPNSEGKAPMTSKAANSAVNGALDSRTPAAPHDDFSVPSETSTSPDDTARLDEAKAAKLEGLGISNSTLDPSLFSQTKRSSDDLVASMQGTPSPQASKSEQWTNVGDSMTSATSNDRSQPPSPSPRQRSSAESSSHSKKNTSSPHRIPKYKIALAANILSPARSAA